MVKFFYWFKFVITVAEKWTPFYHHVWVTLLRMVVRDNVQSRFLPSHGAFRCTARSTYKTGWKCFLKRFLPFGNKQIYAAYVEWNWKSLILLSLFRARTACAISKSVSRIKRGKRPCITKGSLKMVFIIYTSLWSCWSAFLWRWSYKSAEILAICKRSYKA